MRNVFTGTPSKLGFGLMRLPRDKDGNIDAEETSRMVDAALEAGITYFDTAYVYEGSEDAIRKALVERHPRNTFTLTDKLNAGAAKNEEDAKNQIHVSLERTGAGYFDYYLLHAISEDNIDRYEKFHIWDYMHELLEKGLILHYAFSFHGKPELLDRLLTEHPDVSFVQLQINYADWESPTVEARKNWEVCRKHGKQVVVMEPVKGGTLANPPKPVAEILQNANPDASFASFAIRWVASKEGIMTVLSGMSNLSQMKDNLSYMMPFTLMTEQEEETIQEAQKALAGIENIPCTACHYCTGGCPKKIAIPDIFSAMNMYLVFGDLAKAKQSYAWDTEEAKASDCIRCGQCERQCPQHLPIRQLLEKTAAQLEETRA